MARQLRKQCIACQQLYYGRRDAKTCSERCRKRLQRAVSVTAEELHAIKREAVQALESLEKTVEPTYATEGGFIASPFAEAGPAPGNSAKTFTGQQPEQMKEESLEPNAQATNGLSTPWSATSQETRSSGTDSFYSAPEYKNGRWHGLRRGVITAGLAMLLVIGGSIGFALLQKGTNSGNPAFNVSNDQLSDLSEGGNGTLKINYNTQAQKNLEVLGVLAIGQSPVSTGPSLQVAGDISASGNLILGGNNVCTPNGCTVKPGTIAAGTGKDGVNGTDGTDGKDGAKGDTGPQGPAGSSGAATCPFGNCVSLQATTPGTAETGNLNITGTIIAGSFIGDGSGLNNVDAATLSGNNSVFYTNASNISSGTLNDSRLSVNVTKQGNIFNGSSQLVQLTAGGLLPAINGSNLTNVNAAQLNGQAGSYYTNASNISSGTLNDLRLSPNVTLQGNTFNGTSQLVQLTAGGLLPVLDGSNLTSVNAALLNGQNGTYYTNASNISSGTLNDSRLSSNVPLKNSANIFTALNNFTGGLQRNGSDVCDTSGNCAGVGGTGDILNGGNTFGSDVTLGANDNFGLNLETDGNTVASFSNNGAVVFQNFADSAAAFQIQDSTGSSNLFIADTTNGQIGIGKVPALGALDVNGTIFQNGNQVCDTSGNCVGTGGGGSIGGGGTTGTIVLFTGSGYSIGDSILTQSGGVVSAAGDINVTGQYQVNGSQIASSDLSDSANLAKLNANQTFSGDNTFNSASNSFTGNGSGLTSLNATNISSGTISDLRLSPNVTVQGNTFNGASQLVQLTAGGLLPVLDGSNLTNVNAALLNGQNGAYYTNATNISSGTLSDSRLSGNVALLNGTGPQTFTGNDKFTGTFLAQNAANSATAFQVQRSNGTNLLLVNTTNAEVRLGDSSASGASGALVFNTANQTGAISLITNNPGSSSFTLRLPAESGTICTNAATSPATCTNFAPSTGGTGYIQNGTSVQTNANFAIQSAALGSVGGVIRAAVSQSADLLQFQDSSSNVLTNFTSDGRLKIIGDNSSDISTFATNGNELVRIGRNTSPSENSGRILMYAGGVNFVDITAGRTARFNLGQDNVGLIVKAYTSQTTDLFQLQNSSAQAIAGFTGSGNLYVGRASTATGTSKFFNSGGSGSISLSPNNPSSTDYTLNLPAENGTLCSTGSVCSGYANTALSNLSSVAINTSLLPAADNTIDIGDSTTHSFRTGYFDTSVLSASVDSQASNGALGVGNNNAGAITIGNTTNSTVTVKTKSSSTAFQIQDASGQDFFTADTSGNALSLCNSANCDTVNIATNGDADTINIGDSSDTSVLAGNLDLTGVLNNVSLFNDTSVSNTTDGYQLQIARNAPEGTNALSLYVDQFQEPTITSGNANLILSSSGAQLLLSTSGYTQTSTPIVGTSFDSFGALGLGSSNATGITLGRSGITTTVNGDLTATGAALFKKSSDSTTAFQVQNAAGTNTAFNVDTTNGVAKLRGTDGALQLEDTDSGGVTWQLNPDSTGAIAIGTTTNTGLIYITQTGQTIFQNSTDSTTAFQVQNSSGAPLLAADTSGTHGQITIATFDGGSNPAGALSVQTSFNGLVQTDGAVQVGTYIDGGSTQGSYGTFSNHALSFFTNSQSPSFTLGTNGSALFQNNANSNSAFQIQNSTGGSMMSVDTTNANISLNGVNYADDQAWVTTASLGSGHANNIVCTLNGYVYDLDSGSLQYAKLNADGSITSWSSLTSAPHSADQAGCAVVNGYLYYVGGSGGGATPQSTVSYTRPGANGDISGWKTTTALTTAERQVSVTSYNGYIYVVGGYNGGPTNNTFYGKVNADGTISSWNNTTFTTTLEEVSAVAANGYLYKFGGNNGSNAPVTTVEHATLSTTAGTVGAWTSSGDTALPVALRDAYAVVMNGYVYVYGGETTGPAMSGNVYYAPLNADGTVGSWTTATNAMNAARSCFGGLAVNGYIYAFGGASGTACSTSTTTVQYTSTSRIKLGGSIDLVNLGGERLSDSGSGGSITAGNITAIGDVQIQGNLNTADSASISGNLTNTGYALFQNSANSTTAFQVQNSVGTNLFNIDTTGSIITIAGTTTTFANLKLANAHFQSTQTNVPTIGAPSNCGSSPSAAVTAASTDSAGSFTISTGSGSPTTCDTTFTFNKAYGAAPKSILLTSTTAVGGATGVIDAAVTATSTTTFTIKFMTAAGNPTPSSTGGFYYWVIE